MHECTELEAGKSGCSLGRQNKAACGALTIQSCNSGAAKHVTIVAYSDIT